MPTATMKGTQEEGFVGEDPIDPAILDALGSSMAPLGTSVDTRAGVLLELAGIKAAIRTWHRKQPDEVLSEASAYSARLTEMWTELQILEAHDRQWTRLRTMQVTPVLEEVDRQFKMNQSRIAIMRQDIDLSR